MINIKEFDRFKRLTLYDVKEKLKTGFSSYKVKCIYIRATKSISGWPKAMMYNFLINTDN